MNRKVILSVVASMIVLLVGIPFFMYGEDGYSFPQALLMVILIDLLCYSPVNLVISKKSDEISVLKQILKYIIVAALIMLLLIFFDSKHSFAESLCIALGVTFFIYLSDTIINASVRKLLKTKNNCLAYEKNNIMDADRMPVLGNVLFR